MNSTLPKHYSYLGLTVAVDDMTDDTNDADDAAEKIDDGADDELLIDLKPITRITLSVKRSAKLHHF